ncbi:MAG: LysR family transcriptional regulator, partial [Peptococcaceae bacterium]
MRLEYFEYLIEIAKQRNMRLSSEYLHMTPQALSVCIKNMEQEVGFPILVRKPKGVEFTPEGEKLLACAERIVQDYRQTLQEIHQEQNVYTEHKRLLIYTT